ncbi:hypothetical protein ILUMI_16167 [Ignelater luminosus]|uniref:PiggyBac transposable element-derived protein domain-containing protein n=1 Tax=Ignelater luminosus TaxID=2038154 RepID=A0A8K0CRQ7_IGNLU|nr:hypothetical protein ILUMI_16167 [Ignelater luminosus]
MYKEQETESLLKEFLKQEDTQKAEEEGPKRHNLNSVRNEQKERQNHTGNEADCRLDNISKDKKHKFRVKVYKLCLDGGCTYDLQIYCGNDKTVNKSTVPDNVAFHLANNLLNVERTIYTDHFCTAHSLLNRNTNLVGILTLNPKEVADAKLKKEEIIGMESNTGVTVTKWKDKREVQNILLTWWMSIKGKK